MRIGIIGGGSIGLLYAYYLSQAFSVTIYTRTIEQADLINREGIWLKKKEHRWHGNVSATQVDGWQGLEDITIITVKQYQLGQVLSVISKCVDHRGRLLFLQNGMGHVKKLMTLPHRQIYVGSVEHGAYRENGNTVHHNGVGVTRLAELRGDRAFLKHFANEIPSSFPFVFEEDYYNMLIKKLIVNAAINPLTAVLQVKNGELIDNPHFYKILQNIFAELTKILKLDNQVEYFNHIVNVCENTAQNRSSMLKDLERNQETEVDAILGYLLEEAENNDIYAPLVRTFYNLVKGKEYKGKDKLNF